MVLKIRGAADGVRVEAEVTSGGEKIALGDAPASGQVRIGIPNLIAWSPSNPNLYDLCVRLVREGKVIDEVGSYFAMCKFGLVKDADGHLRFALNGEPLFFYGPLDQGFFPEGLYTPPSEEAMVFDIEYTRVIGCNMIRKLLEFDAPPR